MQLQILTVDNHADYLHKPSKKIKNIFSDDISLLIVEMKKILENPGVAGISANQVGKLYRIFGLQPDKKMKPKFYINPKIIRFSSQTIREPEGCLSIPGKYGLVERSAQIEVQYRNLLDKVVTETFDGFNSRAIQHECGHIDGILYTDIAEIVLDNEQAETAFDKA